MRITVYIIDISVGKYLEKDREGAGNMSKC